MKYDLRIFSDKEQLGRAAARLFTEQAALSIAERNRFMVVLNGGGTPTRLLQLLATDFHGQIEWGKVHVFWGDERCVPPEDPGSSYRQAVDLLLSRVTIPGENIHRIRGELGPQKAAEDYARVLHDFASPPLAWPRFDLVYLGMGEDGHTASLFPDSPVEVSELVLPVIARYQDRPAERVTLTPVVFNSAHLVVFMATGEAKARIIAEVLSGRYNPQLYPVQRIETKEGTLVWLVDEDAASQLSPEQR